MLVSSRVGGIFTGVPASVGHRQVGNPNGWVLQSVVEEHDTVLEGWLGETLSVNWVENSDVVPLTINGFPYPGHLVKTDGLKGRQWLPGGILIIM